MELASIKADGKVTAAIITDRGYVCLETLNELKRTAWPVELKQLVEGPELRHLLTWYNAGGKAVVDNINRRYLVEKDKAELTGEPFCTEEE